MSATTAAAVIGRLVTGLVVDRLNRRLVASGTLVIQIAGLSLLAWAPSAVVVYAGCALFGMGVGNLTTLPGLILAVEWPRAAVQRARWAGGRHQSVYVCLRAFARGRRA